MSKNEQDIRKVSLMELEVLLSKARSEGLDIVAREIEREIKLRHEHCSCIGQAGENPNCLVHGEQP